MPAAFDGSRWAYDWQPANGADGVTYAVTARITDAAGQVMTDTQNIVVDLIPPAVFTPTLTYRDGGGNIHPVGPGQTISATNPTLIVEWTASSDGAGLSEYLVSWTDSPAPDPGSAASVAQRPRHNEYLPGEAQVVYAHVIARDHWGNERLASLGPVYVDSPYTPDLVSDPRCAAGCRAAPHSSPSTASTRTPRACPAAALHVVERGHAGRRLVGRGLGLRRRPLCLPRHRGRRCDHALRSLRDRRRAGPAGHLRGRLAGVGAGQRHCHAAALERQRLVGRAFPGGAQLPVQRTRHRPAAALRLAGPDAGRVQAAGGGVERRCAEPVGRGAQQEPAQQPAWSAPWPSRRTCAPTR
ncbi:MAG: hypothetical protein HZY76_03375 [Anaerolineae bacterium]|nr:MAG: hypothetical protein HZY76_03375 [Anaerolineae bacterium]